MIRFEPENPPTRVEEIIGWVYRHFQTLAGVVNNIASGQREVRYSEPEKVFIGMLVYADGTNWNPGGGAGTYEYTGGGTNGWRMLASGVQY